VSSPGEQIRDYWDIDSATYDRAAAHNPQTHLERAAWRGTLRQLLPPPPAPVLDAGAGTGFLSLLLAELGYQVTALDLSSRMLDRLRGKAAQHGLHVETVEGDATLPPAVTEGFDVVIERHLCGLCPIPPRRSTPGIRAPRPAGSC
jgi:2-polyprenyl-3-methyl-5-hydroxy-6-metoxy-1,4-benzoquinol methylase